MDDGWGRIIQEAHDWVDELRRSKGLSPIDWRTKVSKREPLEGITVNGVPLKVVVEEQERTEIEKVHRSEIGGKSVGIGYTGSTGRFGNTSGARSQYTNRIGEMSREVIEHLNYLQRSQGEKAVTDFLNKPQQVSNQGSIESAVKDAEEKVRYYAAQAARMQQEVARWEAIKQQLNGALQLLSGKAPVLSTPVNGRDSSGRRDWPTLLKSVMGTETMTRRDLRHKLKALDPDLIDQTIYAAVNNGLKREYLLETEAGLTFVGPKEAVSA